MSDPLIAARRAVAAARCALAQRGVRSRVATTALAMAAHAVATALDRGHHVTDIHSTAPAPGTTEGGRGPSKETT